MRTPTLLHVVRALVLVALATSVALLVDYSRTVPAFCANGSGCDAVRQSALGYVGGIPLLPILGTAGFFVLGLVAARPRWPLLVAGALLGGVTGAALLVVQVAVVGAVCWMCAVVDTSAVLIAVLTLLARRGGGGDVPSSSAARPGSSPSSVPMPVWLALSMGAIVVPASFGKVRLESSVPAEIRALERPGTLTIVEFEDFECEYCRLAHPRLESVKARIGAPLEVVRKTYPLPFHTKARPLSRAYVCAREQGKGEPMAHALFTTDDLGEARARELAHGLGIDLERYDACLAERADRLVDEDMEFVRRAGLHGLPTVYIGREVFVGARSEEEYAAAAARALGRASDAAGWGWVGTAFAWSVRVVLPACRIARRSRAADAGGRATTRAA